MRCSRPPRFSRCFRPALLLAAALGASFGATSAMADKIKNPTAVFAGLDKITGRIISFEAQVDETVQFGSLQLTARVCYSRPDYENPQTSTFIEVDEVLIDNKVKRVFAGWMFADSPGLNAIEHPVYDVWLTECKGGKEIIKTLPEPEDAEEVAVPQLPDELKKNINRQASSRSDAKRKGNPPLRLPDSQPGGQPTPAGPAVPRQRFFPINPGAGGRYDPGPRG